MTYARTLCITGLLTLAFGGMAHAATMIAGPLTVPNGHRIVCLLVNLDDNDLQDLEITAKSDNESTTLFAPLAPGASQAKSDLNDAGSFNGYCRFRFKGGKKNLSATACVSPGIGQACTSAVPAK